jgi:DinB superfamily
MPLKSLNQSIDIWKETIKENDFESICIKPDEKNWSLGQVVIHLLEDTKFYFDQIKICLNSNENSQQEMTSEGKLIFKNQAFPDIQIEGNPLNNLIPQSQSKEMLLSGLIALKDEANTLYFEISNTSSLGKNKHPGLGYFNAMEWFQFAEMHFRHHLRQKLRIENYLQNSRK